MNFNIRNVAHGYCTAVVSVNGVTIDLGMLNGQERIILAEQLRAAAEEFNPDYRHPAQLACEAATDVIYAKGAPLGSEEYFEIRGILVEGAR